MRVLMLSWRGPEHPRAGGAEVYTRRVLAGLARRGHQVTWLCEHSAVGDVDGVRMISGGGGVRVYPAGWRFLGSHAAEFDIVVDQINTAGFLTPLYSRIPVLALVHQTAAEVWRYDGAGPLRYLGPYAEGLMLRAYRNVPFVTVSRTSLADLRARGWVGWAEVAYNGMDRPGTGCIHPKEPRPTLVFLARWSAAAKRLDHALQAYALVRSSLPEAQLWVIGRGTPPRRPPPGVSFFADVPDARRDELLARAWLLVATSVREGWGRMILEAAAAGTPCAVYGSPGLSEAAAAVEGRTVAESPAALADAALHLLREPATLQTMGVRAMALVGRFSWSRAVAVWEAALHRAAGAGRVAPTPPASGR